MIALHKSPFAGRWYPERQAALERLLDERFAESERRTGPLLPSAALAFVTPHAGPAYSGTVAAAVYRAIAQQQPERIVVLAFPHRGMLRGVVSPDVRGIATPLGDIAIENSFAAHFRSVPEERLCDHSFEIQLPFLQRSAPGARVTPLYVGAMSAEERSAAASTLADAWRPGTVFLASSDFTHYGPSFDYVPFPADASTRDRIHALDFDYIEAAGSLDSLFFLETLRRHDATVCGSGPIALLLDSLRRLEGESVYQMTLDYQTSGELESDWQHSVSYAGLAYYHRSAFDLGPEDRAALLDSAEETLRRLRANGRDEPVPAVGGSPALATRRAAFVSLHQGEELLGCIGNLVGRSALREDIANLVLSAAQDDPRFRPAATATGPVQVEISLLTPFRRTAAGSEFVIGRHGAYMKLGAHSGLLLPQVAEDREWTAEDFLRAVARKSMLPPGAWRDPNARLYIFEAQIIARD